MYDVCEIACTYLKPTYIQLLPEMQDKNGSLQRHRDHTVLRIPRSLRAQTKHVPKIKAVLIKYVSRSLNITG